jgi:hypothetical protein
MWFVSNNPARRLGPLLLAPLLLVASMMQSEPALALTPAGTTISATATNTFQDQGANNYSVTSNTVTVTVQNAPVLTVTAPTNQSVTPAMIVVDTFSLANTGNDSGNFQLSTDAVFTGSTASGTTLKGYVYGTNCTIAAPCTLAIVNNASNLNAAGNVVTAGGAPITIGVEYQVGVSATLAQTVLTTLSANITYAAGTGTSQGTSSNVTAMPTDTLATDARLDVQTTVVNPTATSTPGSYITWTVRANNGGANPALNLLSARAALGNVPAVGVVLFVPMPVYSSTYLQLTGTPTLTTGTLSAGATAALYYNANPCSSHTTGGWSTGYAAASECLAVYVSGGSSGGAELPGVPSTTQAGSVTSGQAQITLSFTTTPPSGTGSGSANAVTLVATGAVGGVVWATGTFPILGQGVTMGAGDIDAATASLLNPIESNATVSSGIIAPGGASNSIGSYAYASYSVSIGPYGQAQATGAWSGSTNPGYTTGTANSSNDFSFVDYDSSVPSINAATNYALAPSGNSIANSGPVTINGTILNAGNLADSFNLTAGALTNWTATFQCYNALAAACGVGDLQFACHVGNITATPTVASSATYNICATFTPSANVTTLSALAWLITATSVGSSGVNNTTYDVLYPGGVLVAFRSAAVSLCPGAFTPAPGCTITYTVSIVNEAPIASAGTGAGNVSVTPSSSAVITENAAATGNNWGTYSAGLKAVPTFISCTGCTTTGVATSKNFTVTIPSSDLAPQATATYSYAVVVN